MYHFVRRLSTQTVIPSQTVYQAIERAGLPAHLLKRGDLLTLAVKRENHFREEWEESEKSVKETIGIMFNHIIPRRYNRTPARSLLKEICLDRIDIDDLRSLEGKLRSDRRLRELFWDQLTTIENRVLVRQLPIENIYDEPRLAPPYILRSFWTACLFSLIHRTFLIRHAVQIGKPLLAECRITDDTFIKKTGLAVHPRLGSPSLFEVRILDRPKRYYLKSLTEEARQLAGEIPLSDHEQIQNVHLSQRKNNKNPVSLDTMINELLIPDFPKINQSSYLAYRHAIRASSEFLSDFQTKLQRLEEEYQSQLDSPYVEDGNWIEDVYHSLHKTNIMLSVIKEEIIK
jgi:hypothetical protein